MSHSLTIDPELISALAATPDGDEPLHIRLATQMDRRPDNVKRSLERHTKSGWLTRDGAISPALRGMLAKVTGAAAPQAAADALAENTVPLNALVPSGLNYRKTFDPDALAELAASLMAKGQLQNLLARPDPKLPGTYQVLAGERRLRAFQLLVEQGQLPHDAPVLVNIRECDDTEALELSLEENDKRADVDKLEQAEGYARLQDSYVERGDDPARATATISERLGCTRRIVQRRIKAARTIIPEARDAWAAGQLDNFAMIEEMARWPAEAQRDALASLLSPHSHLTDSRRLRAWLERGAPEVGQQPFKLQAYLDAGGTLIEPDEEDAPQRFASRALAEECLHAWIDDKAAALAKKHGYGALPVRETFYDSGAYPDARSAPDAMKRVFFAWNPSTLAVDVIHPVAERIALRGAEAGQQAVAEHEAAKAEASASGYSKRNWMAGAEVRTGELRDAIMADPRRAMALAIMAVIGGGAERASDDGGPIYLKPAFPSGEAGQIGRGGLLRAYIAGTPLAGVRTDHDALVCTDRLVATAALMERDDLELLFSAAIADHVIDCGYTAAPGALPESRAVMAHEPPATGFNREDWLKAYTADQLAAHVAATGTDTSDLNGIKKTEAVQRAAELLPSDWTPPECQFTAPDEMTRDTLTILKGNA